MLAEFARPQDIIDTLTASSLRGVWWFIRKNPNGPYETIMEYPKGTKTFEQMQELLPKTRRRYLNPETGKDVAYTRAKELGLVS
jgi:hypothetical protein